MYRWRELTEKQRKRVLEFRRIRQQPWHRPPHLDFDGSNTFIITAACYEHRPIIGRNADRMAEFEQALLEACSKSCDKVWGWCLLPNHYHLLAETDRVKELRRQIGLLHGRTSRRWNIEDRSHGRKVWYNYFDREMKSRGHYWASLNYIHNNAVHHGYVEKWQDWPFSSVDQFFENVDREKAEQIWRDYPVLDYGKGWDTY